MSRASFERKLRDGNQEEKNEKTKTDKVFLCKPLLFFLEGLFTYRLQRGSRGLSSHHPRVVFEDRSDPHRVNSITV
jgi:hypothetical protein